MKKTCGVSAVLWAGCTLLMGFLAWRRIAIAAIPGGFIGGLLLWLGLAYISGVGDKIRTARLIRRAQNGEPPRDGEVVAVIGRLMPLDDTLLSPFRREPCLAYNYRVAVPHSKTTTTDYHGIALVPSTIGSTKLLAWPQLDVPETYCHREEEQRNALEYAEQTHFTVATMFKPDKTRVPRLRYDHRNHIATNDSLKRGLLYESVLRPNEEVCALGYYSLSEGGLTHEPDTLVPTLKVMNGDPAAIRARLVRRSIGNIIGGLVLIALAAAGLFILYRNVPLEAAEQMSPNRTTWWWEVRLERLVAHHEPNESTPTMLDPGEARGRIVVGDREVRPTTAIASGDTIRFGDGDAIATIDGSRLTHLELLGKSIDGATFEDLGDREGRITYIGDDAKCRIAFKAAGAK